MWVYEPPWSCIISVLPTCLSRWTSRHQWPVMFGTAAVSLNKTTAASTSQCLRGGVALAMTNHTSTIICGALVRSQRNRTSWRAVTLVCTHAVLHHCRLLNQQVRTKCCLLWFITPCGILWQHMYMCTCANTLIFVIHYLHVIYTQPYTHAHK